MKQLGDHFSTSRVDLARVERVLRQSLFVVKPGSVEQSTLYRLLGTTMSEIEPAKLSILLSTVRSDLGLSETEFRALVERKKDEIRAEMLCASSEAPEIFGASAFQTITPISMVA